jgi:fatty-acyl-CoA synthase
MNVENKFELGLGKTEANFCSLSPISFLRRTASVYPNLVSVIYEDRRFSRSESYARCKRVASFLSQKGIGRGDTVAALLPNIPAMYELHFAVPMTGAVLNALNIRFNAEAIAFMLRHGEAKVVFVDPEFETVLADALNQFDIKPLVIRVDDAAFSASGKLGEIEYEAAVRLGDPDFSWTHPADEWDAIALSYTSGTTGDPKGVVTHHRGAYLNAVSNLLSAGVSERPLYLWTLPLFHCNGWCFPWSIAAAAGTNICLRKVDPQRSFSSSNSTPSR